MCRTVQAGRANCVVFNYYNRVIIRIIKYLGITTLVISYGLLIANYVIHDGQEYFTPLFNAAWISGAVSVVSNAAYAIKIEISDLALSLFGLCSLFWFAPFFDRLNPSYGFPSLIGFALLVIYIHLRKKNETNPSNI